MAELIWRDVYERAVELFGGQTPGAQLEADIVERFELIPTSVVAAIDKLGERFKAGRVHSPWPLVLRELDAQPERDVRASDESDRARAIHLAERYVATAGLFLPCESELVAELFGARGRLRHWPELRARMVTLWQASQPIAAQVEAEALDRAERWRTAHAAMQHLRTERITDGHAPQTVSQSQTSAALTAVSAHTAALDVDADIAW